MYTGHAFSTDRQAPPGRQRDRRARGETGRPPGRQRDRQAIRGTDRQAEKQTGSRRDRQAVRQAERQTGRQNDKQTDRVSVWQLDLFYRQAWAFSAFTTHTQTHKCTHTHTHSDRSIKWFEITNLSGHQRIHRSSLWSSSCFRQKHQIELQGQPEVCVCVYVCVSLTSEAFCTHTPRSITDRKSVV